MPGGEAPQSYVIRRVARTWDGNTYVEVRFNTGLLNDFIFSGFPATEVGFQTDPQGRRFFTSAFKERPFDIERVVHDAIRQFAASIPTTAYPDDMRDHFHIAMLKQEDHPHTRSMHLSVGREFRL